MNIDQFVRAVDNCWNILEFKCPNSSMGVYIIAYAEECAKKGKACTDDDIYRLHALLKQLVSTSEELGNTLHFKDPSNRILDMMDKNPTFGKKIFVSSDDINTCFESLRRGIGRPKVEERSHWKFNKKFDKIIPPDIPTNSTKGYERNQFIKMVLVLLGLITNNNNSNKAVMNICRIVCMALGLTSTGMLIYNIYIYTFIITYISWLG